MSTKKDQIILAALKLFTEKGIDSTSTASIAKLAGVGTGTVFHHFASKVDVVNACFVLVKQRLQDMLKEVKGENREELTFLYWSSTINWYLSHPVEMTFINLYQQDPKINEGKSLAFITKTSNFVMSFFKEGQSEGVVKNAQTDYVLLMAHNATLLAAQYLIENPEIDKEEFIETSYELFRNGVSL